MERRMKRETADEAHPFDLAARPALEPARAHTHARHQLKRVLARGSLIQLCIGRIREQPHVDAAAAGHHRLQGVE